MVTETVKKFIYDLIKREGGYVNSPHDKGGPTNKGITIKTLSMYLGRPASIKEVKELDYGVAFAIYEKMFYRDSGVSKLPENIQEIVLDACVLHGQGTAIELLQELINSIIPEKLKVDGILGPITVDTVSDFIDCCGIVSTINSYVELRKQYCEKLAVQSPTQKKNLKGWLNRLSMFERENPFVKIATQDESKQEELQV